MAEFLLFAGGEIDRGDDGRELARRLPRFHAFRLLPAAGSTFVPPTAPGGGPPWRFPVDIESCVALVLDIAGKMDQSVRVVDVNRPGDDRGLVDRWVTEASLLPMLVSPTGRTLEGTGSFVPSAVRKFLSRG